MRLALPGSALGELLLISSIVLFAVLNAALYGGILTPARHAEAVLSPSQRAELDDSRDLPGRFVPTQGRQHIASLYPDYQRIEFCEADRITNACYASNPPTSGTHLAVQRVRLSDGRVLSLPPDPGVYNIVVPREAIPHIEEHAGVYVGYNCASGACAADVESLVALVKEQISAGARVVMSPDPDLGDDTIALASWTRIDSFAAAEYSDERARDFIQAHSCRFDPEGKCSPGGRSVSLQ